MDSPLSLLIIDDHILFRDGLRRLLEELSKDVILYEASSCQQTQEQLQAHPDVDLVLLDIGLPDIDGFTCLENMHKINPLLPVVILSGNATPDDIRKAIDLGARGFIPKSDSKEILISALKLVLAGGIYIPPMALHSMPSGNTTHAPSSPNSLTPRQIEVLRLLAKGASNKHIANTLGSAESTVRVHVTAILKALGVSNRTSAALKAKELGLLFQ